MLGVRRRGFSGTVTPTTAAVMTALGRTATAVGTGGSGGESWQLDSGHWVPAKMPPVIVSPRPDSETNVWEGCRRWPSETPYRWLVEIQGSAWPGHYELVSDGGMVGLTIGEDLPSDWLTNGLQSYGVLRCASPAIGTYTITVRYTDQDLVAVEVTFTLQILDREDTTYFVWVSASTGNDTTGTGSYSNPFRTHGGWYGVDRFASTHTGKQLHYRAGTYLITDAPLTGSATPSQLLRMGQQKPQVFNAVEGETVIFDNENRAYFFQEANTGGCAYIGIQWVNPQTTELPPNGRKQFIRVQSEQAENRFVATFNYFDGAPDTGIHGSNSSCIMLADITGTESNFGYYGVISRNTFHRIFGMDYLLTYTTRYMVFAGNRMTGGHADGQGCFIKGGSHSHITCRANVALDCDGPIFFLSEFTDDIKENVEFCWNSGYCPTATDGGYGVVAFGQGSSSENHTYGSIWIYRNNIRADRLRLTAVEGGPVVVEYNVLQCGAAYVANQGVYLQDAPEAMTSISNNVAATSGLFDSTTNLLTGSARVTYLGTHGCEVA